MKLKDLKAKLQSRLEWIEKHKKKLPEIELEVKRQLSLVTEAEAIEENLQKTIPAGPWIGQKELVLRILQGTDQPLTVREIEKGMIMEGYHFRAKNSPRNSVYVLLNRMEKDGKLNKQSLSGRLHFSLKQKGVNHEM